MLPYLYRVYQVKASRLTTPAPQISNWVTVFTLPYMYYSANLGPKTGFVFTGLCYISLAYVYFCVGEVTGRSMEEIEGFFQNVSAEFSLYAQLAMLYTCF